MIADNDNELPRTRAEAKAIGSKWYFTGKPCKHGHVSMRYTSGGRCVECQSDYLRKWSADNPEYYLERNRVRRAADPEAAREYQRRWWAANPDLTLEYQRKWRGKNEEEVRAYSKRWFAENRNKARGYQSKRRSTPRGRLESNIRSGMYRGIAKGSKSGRKTFDILGYTVDDLRAHLEGLFQDGMTWENYGEWHVDHKIPLAAHNYVTPDDIDFKRAWAISNLQPLWAKDNLSKNDKLTAPFQPSLALAA
ncbi:hypothetical protein LB559_09085 [Mesorhizobium sp. BR1-1-3]|uniref:hypothetical protein n=1 Tax=Mesorhizobium sp. BR1-1-3 TaxID=2876651 RepID=UPI001CD1651F|nr:hypothetical protein [Mesorhizobium sp. BR1-1-3]MBZ9888092.1 hypothetical protein [Mesorhizobium sp. BR1-1-3]